jgi:hypothetical protein
MNNKVSDVYCRSCGTPFTRKRGTQIFCSDGCRSNSIQAYRDKANETRRAQAGTVGRAEQAIAAMLARGQRYEDDPRASRPLRVWKPPNAFA